jgi:hypothetical protein
MPSQARFFMRFSESRSVVESKRTPVAAKLSFRGESIEAPEIDLC